MIVYITQMKGCSNKCVWGKLEDAIEEIKDNFIDATAEDADELEFSIKVSEMSEAEYKTLGEFEGY